MLLLTTAMLCARGALAATAAASCATGTPDYAAADGGFGVLSGQIYAPNGTPFIAHGVDVMEGDEPSVSQLQSAFPGVNFVRLAIYDYASPASLSAYVDSLTSAGIVVELEDHTTSDGSNAGGATGTVFTGQQLTTELNWYSSIASAFASNPYVWFGTDNEPPTDPSAAALSTWQQQTYNAIRSAGYNAPILMEEPGGGDPTMGGTDSGLTPSVYASMTNIIYDVHFYGWDSNYSTDQSTVDQALASTIAAAQTIISAEGTVPVIIGEYGNSETDTEIAPNANQVITAVQSSGYGSAAWAWGMGTTDGLTTSSGTPSAYGQQIASYIATSGVTGCAVAPTAIPTTAASSTSAPAASPTAAPTPASSSATATTPAAASTAAPTAATDAPVTAPASTMSIADVANLASQGTTASEQSIGGVAQLANTPATGADVGATLATDPTAAAVLASGPAASASSIVLTENAPGGTMPTPAPVTGTTSFTASGDYQTIVPAAGNDTGSVTGTGNTINATGGIQNITVTGPGNTITTGPYNDTVTVSSAGNVINLGGGNDALILAYNGQQPSATINADAAALPPLASVGNVIELPAPGTGVLTIDGVLAANDTLDLTQALAGTTWNHTQATLWNYVSAAPSAQGCEISVGGHVIAILPNGSPSGQLGDFVTAS